MQMLKCRFCIVEKACEDGGRKRINREGSLCSLSWFDDGEDRSIAVRAVVKSHLFPTCTREAEN